MNIARVFHAIQTSGWATDLRESALVYPVIMSLHLTAIALFGGLILITDLRLLGLILHDVPVTNVVKGLRPWKRLGFTIMVTCGMLLAASKADQYYVNPYFQLKMFLLLMVGVHALIFKRSVYGVNAPSARNARLAACVSLALWLGIMSLGRWIAYYEGDREKPGARVEVGQCELLRHRTSVPAGLKETAPALSRLSHAAAAPVLFTVGA